MTSANKKNKKIFLFGLAFFIFAALFLVMSYGRKKNDADSNSLLGKNNASIVDCQQQIACPDCNIMLISVDSLRADHVGVFGYNRPTTPFFDSFSQKGFLFTNYFSSAYLTPVSEMALHTGMYPSSSGVVSFGSSLPENLTMLAQFLKKEGYKTYASHTSPEYINRPVTPDTPRYSGETAMPKNFERGFDVHKGLIPRKITLENKNNIYKDISDLKNDKFFYWLTVGSIHWPYGPKESADPANGGVGIYNIFGTQDYKGYFAGKKVNWDVLRNIYGGIVYPEKKLLTKEDMDFIVDNYDNSIFQFDDFLKELVGQLAENGLMEKTIIIIESEHGEDFGEHGYIAHYDIYEDQTHVPLLIILPNIGAGKKIDSFAGSVDVFPTLASLIGRIAPPQVKGRSFVPEICGKEYSDKEKNREAAFIERIPLWEQVPTDLIKATKDGGLDPKTITGDIAIRTREWKYILRTSRDFMQKANWWSKLTGKAIKIPKEELYNVALDPKELNNVASANPEVAKNLKERLLSWYGMILNKENLDRRPSNFQEYF